jgi:glycosyltransferase involved in cell wall biosynthesis
VVYLGRLPYKEVAQVAAHAVVSYVPMVAPERERMFSPLKLYESMACGVPVVATDVIGISEVVNESQCGILIQAGDAEGLAAATDRLLRDPQLAREMGVRGRDAVVEHYSWRARARQRKAVIEDAIERSREAGTSEARPA